MAIDERAYYPFYGIYTNDWTETFAPLTNHHYLLVDEYISKDASTTSSSAWVDGGVRFLYPHHIKKKYYVEGIIEGHITLSTHPNNVISYVSNYRITLEKYGNGVATTLAQTGTITVNDNLTATGEWIVYPFWMEIWQTPAELGENERLGIKVEWDIGQHSSTSAYLVHDNWQQGEDMKITLPLLL